MKLFTFAAKISSKYGETSWKDVAPETERETPDAKNRDALFDTAESMNDLCQSLVDIEVIDEDFAERVHEYLEQDAQKNLPIVFKSISDLVDLKLKNITSARLELDNFRSSFGM